MFKPCTACEAYTDERCRVLASLQAQAPRTEGRADCLDELLNQRPCQFSAYIKRLARRIINARGLEGQVEADDIHSIVQGELWMYNIRLNTLTHEEFRRYVTVMIRHAVDREYKKLHGDYCCGNCTSYLPQRKTDTGWCEHPEIKDATGQCVIVESKTDPGTVEHGVNEVGCAFYTSRQFVSVDELLTLQGNDAAAETDEIEEAFQHMEALGTRQQRQARILREMLDGEAIQDIAKELCLGRSAVSELLWGWTKTEDGVEYHQAGAFHLFWSIYKGGIFRLEQAENSLWAVVNQRDFSQSAALPSFNEIARQLALGKRETIERYKAGWEWINIPQARGGGNMNGRNKQNEKESLRVMQHAAMRGSVAHPDFYALLSYAEGVLGREERQYVAAHLLTCMVCVGELEQIETVILPEMERPINAKERLKNMLRQLISSNSNNAENSLTVQLPVSPAVSQNKIGALPGFQFNYGVGFTQKGQQGDMRIGKISIRGFDETYRFLTILDIREQEEAYLLISSFESRKGPVYCWPVDVADAELPFVFDQIEGHYYQAYITDCEIAPPPDTVLNLRVNRDDYEEDRTRLLANFFEVLLNQSCRFRLIELKAENSPQ